MDFSATKFRRCSIERSKLRCMLFSTRLVSHELWIASSFIYRQFEVEVAIEDRAVDSCSFYTHPLTGSTIFKTKGPVMAGRSTPKTISVMVTMAVQLVVGKMLTTGVPSHLKCTRKHSSSNAVACEALLWRFSGNCNVIH